MVKIFDEEIELPLADNTPEALQIYRVSLGDARDLSAIVDGAV
jgi:hypothetical protein